MRHAGVEAQRPHHALDPVVQALRRRGTGKDVAGSTHGGDEHLGTGTVDQPHGGAGKVDEQLLAGQPVLAHRALERLGKRLVVFAELRVAPGAALGVGGHVLLPQQHQRHALAIELAVHAAPVGFDEGVDLFSLSKVTVGDRALA
nr:hypothetical protein [uncultured bacterium]